MGTNYVTNYLSIVICCYCVDGDRLRHAMEKSWSYGVEEGCDYCGHTKRLLKSCSGLGPWH